MGREITVPEPFPAEQLLGTEIIGGEGSIATDVLNVDSSLAQSLPHLVLRVLPPAAVFIMVILVWQVVVPAVGLKDYQLPVPSTIWKTFISSHVVIVSDGWFTFWNEAFRGYLLGSAIGLITAILCWRSTTLARGLLPYAVASSAIPIVALAPALVVIAGSDWQSKVIICAIMTSFPMTVSAYRGLSSVDESSMDLLSTYAADGRHVLLKLHLPAALPFIFNALKINTTLAMIGAIVAEYFGSPSQGLGLYIFNNAGDNVYPQVWAAVLVACVIGILFYLAVLMIERRVTGWHVSYR